MDDGYWTITMKKPKEGQEVYVCLHCGGLYRLKYENGWFVRRDADKEQLLFSERAITKWKPVPDGV